MKRKNERERRATSGSGQVGHVSPSTKESSGEKRSVYEVLWPCGEKGVALTPVAKRLDSLRGKTVCELWDFLFRGDKIFHILEEELKKRYPGISFVSCKDFGSTHGAEEKKVIQTLPSALREKGCDAVISSVGC